MIHAKVINSFDAPPESQLTKVAAIYDFPLSLHGIEVLEALILQSQNPVPLRAAIDQVYRDNIAAAKQAVGEEKALVS